MKKKVLVLGGGASGLGVAWKLAENNIPVELIELKNEIGGLAATVRKDGYYLDYGPHYFLSEKPEIIKKVTGLFKEDFFPSNEARYLQALTKISCVKSSASSLRPTLA